MATSKEYIEFVIEKVEKFGTIRTSKMFGEYMVYLNDRPILTVCDNTVFVKKHPEIGEVMKDVECGCPYDGAKENYILDIENKKITEQVIPILGKIVPIPKPRKRNEESL